MKTIIRLLIVMAIVAICAGCSASKNGMKQVVKVPSEALYSLALKALEARSFIIEADGEFFFSDQKSRINPQMLGSEIMKTAAGGGNFISVQDDRIEIRFAPKVLSGRQTINQELQAITHFDSQLKRNGDHIYTLRTNGNWSFDNYEIIIRLFDNTNQCYIHITSTLGRPIINFPGKVYPYKKVEN